MLYSEDIERILIGNAIVNGRLSVGMRVLAVPDFYFKRNQEIWSAIIGIDEDGEEINAFEIHQRCTQDNPNTTVKVSELAKWTTDIPASPPRESDLKQFREMAVSRRFQKTLDALAKRLEDGKLHDVLDEAENTVESIKGTVDKVDSPVKKLSDVLVDDVYPRLEKFVAGEVVKVPFGFAKLDEATNGGASPGELVIWGAKPKRGKSGLMLQTAAFQAESGFPSYVVSREMLNYENGFRFLSQRSHYSNNVFRPDLMAPTVEKLKQVGANYGQIPLYFDDRSKKISEIRRNVKVLKQECDLHTVHIDYAQLIRPDSKRNNRAEDLEQIYYDAKELAQDFEIVVYLNAQFNRVGIKSDRPTMADFDGSSAAEKAGNLILIWELEHDYSMIHDGKKGTLWIEAGRNVATDEFEIVFHGAHSRFSFL
jgi:replicative DNA helicase